MEKILPSNYLRGPVQGRNIIGEITESLHKFLLEGWNLGGAPPRIEEDLSFVPKDREEVIYVFMYRAVQNAALMNTKRFRLAKFEFEDDDDPDAKRAYWERPPLYLELDYLIAVHSKFRSDAERLLGWTMSRLHEATHLVYRPRRYLLPSGREIDSKGRDWDPEVWEDDLIMEKVSLTLVDDLTVGDAINFFTINEAPYRPYLTYKARCAMEGALVAGPPSPTDVDYSLAYSDAEELASIQRQEENQQGLQAETPGRTENQRGRFPARPVRRTTHVEPNKESK